MMYDWRDTFKSWFRHLRYWHDLARKIHRSLWTGTGLAMLGFFIALSSKQSWVPYAIAIFGVILALPTIAFAVRYSFELRKLASMLPPDISRNDIKKEIKKGPSPLKLILSSIFIMLMLLFPLLKSLYE